VASTIKGRMGMVAHQRILLSALVALAATACSPWPKAPGAAAPMAATMAAPSTPPDAIQCSLKREAQGYQGACQVTCSVNALAINFSGVEPKRACTGAPRTVNADVAKTQVPGKWLGAMQGVQPEDPTRFELVPNMGSSGSVARTPFGWFAVRQMTEATDLLTIDIDARQQVRPTATDLAILDRALEMLPNEALWNKNDNRQCPAGQAKLSLFCALQLATMSISGGVHYRQPALQAVREALNGVDASRIKTHRIMDFNNHPQTTLAEIHDILKRARVSVEKDIR
jgi:hypothetical protein